MSDLAWMLIAAIIVGAAAVVALVYRRLLHALERTRMAHDKEMSRIGSEHGARLGRLTRETEDVLRFAHHGLVMDLLPAIDALVEARQHAQSLDSDEISEGLKLTLSQLEKALAKHGVESITPEPGALFDPHLHEAVQVEELADMPPDCIVRPLRRGYRHEDRVLRPALVVVSQAMAHEETEEVSSVSTDGDGEETGSSPIT
ncbi:MAG: nucleotide exchange factor GrpE [Bradymonadaceae bacterium]